MAAADARGAAIEMVVDLDVVCHRMAGGIGASWHSQSREMTFDEKLLSLDRTNKTARGSGWGGNPPVGDVAKWQRLEELASWLGMDWLRVELQQCSYEPEKDRFDWSDIEMQALYRILDWCERNKADVFLTQMYNNVGWNAYEGGSPVQSAPRNMDDFAVGLATLADHLVNQRKYTCINLTFMVLNKEPVERELVLRLNGIGAAATLHCYQVSEAEITRPAFTLDARRSFQVSAAAPVIKDKLPPSSITVYSTFNLAHSDAGITTD